MKGQEIEAAQASLKRVSSVLRKKIAARTSHNKDDKRLQQARLKGRELEIERARLQAKLDHSGSDSDAGVHGEIASLEKKVESALVS